MSEKDQSVLRAHARQALWHGMKSRAKSGAKRVKRSAVKGAGMALSEAAPILAAMAACAQFFVIVGSLFAGLYGVASLARLGMASFAEERLFWGVALSLFVVLPALTLLACAAFDKARPWRERGAEAVEERLSDCGWAPLRERERELISAVWRAQAWARRAGKRARRAGRVRLLAPALGAAVAAPVLTLAFGSCLAPFFVAMTLDDMARMATRFKTPVSLGASAPSASASSWRQRLSEKCEPARAWAQRARDGAKAKLAEIEREGAASESFRKAEAAKLERAARLAPAAAKGRQKGRL